MTAWLINKFNTLFGRDDWTTVDPNEELKEWIDVKNEKEGLIEQ